MKIDLHSKQGIQNFKRAHLLGVSLLCILMIGGYLLYQQFRPTTRRFIYLRDWFNDPQAHLRWTVRAGQRCGYVPFLIPTYGYIGFLWGDSFRPLHHHQGLDIFGGAGPGKTPVLAAYPGYLTRLPEWKSSVILRIPDDPLHPGRQIWLYYTHMADKQGNSFISPAFPPGASEVFVEAGALLGYQGNFSGDPDNPTGVHLHFSIVKDKDGKFLNELDIANTLDPSPYFGLPLNAHQNPDQIPVCNE
jgi:murein DD-endopeptidase MepM/ murein hydrolase activator NlpD